MTIKELLGTVSRCTRRSQRDISALIGISPQLLSQRVNMGLLKFADACRICDAAGLQIALFDIVTHKRVQFDTDAFSSSGNKTRFEDAVALLRQIGIEVAIVVVPSGKIVSTSQVGYGRRIRMWIDGEEFDTMKATAVSSALNTESHKFGGVEKYNVEDPRELYRRRDGQYFFAVYRQDESDTIDPCDEETADAFILLHGKLE